MKKGAPNPDLASVDALKHTLLAAKSTVLGDLAPGGGAGVYTAGLMERLGLAADLEARIRLVKSGTEVAEAVAKDEAEIGIGIASDAAIVLGLDAFPLPTGAHSQSVYVAGISSGSKEVEAAKLLIVFLTSPPNRQALNASGFETMNLSEFFLAMQESGCGPLRQLWQCSDMSAPGAEIKNSGSIDAIDGGARWTA